jgi:uncharacterized membrane protein
MPGPYFLLFELIIYIQFLICLAHAVKHGTGGPVKLFSAVLFGVLLEIITIWQLNAYQYGRFLIMIADVPLCIGIAWGSIIYSVMEFTDATSLPPMARPLLAGLLALNIDLAMDPIASRLGLWDWGQEPTFQFFGVPYGNFLAWFWVVAAFSAGYYLLSSHRDRIRTWLAGPLAIIVGLIVVFANNAFMAFVLPLNYHFHLVFLVIASALTIIVSLGPQLHQRLVGPPAFWTPFLTLAYVLTAGLISGVIMQPSYLLIITFAMLVILFALHWITIRHMMPRPA